MSRRIRRDDGEIYPSVTAAARALDPSGKKLQSLIGSISSAASGVYGRRTVYGYRYEYIDGEHARVSELAMAVAALSMAVSDLARALKVDGGATGQVPRAPEEGVQGGGLMELLSHLCARCRVGGFHGLPPKNAPEWYVSTVYWWCPKLKTHDGNRTLCVEFRRGEPRKFDEFGEELK